MIEYRTAYSLQLASLSKCDIGKVLAEEECIVGQVGNACADCNMLDYACIAAPRYIIGILIVRHRTDSGNSKAAVALQCPGQTVAAGAGRNFFNRSFGICNTVLLRICLGIAVTSYTQHNIRRFIEGALTDLGNTVRNVNRCQAVALGKRIAVNRGYTIGKGDIRNACTAVEYCTSDFLHSAALCKGYLGQAVTVIERIVGNIGQVSTEGNCGYLCTVLVPRQICRSGRSHRALAVNDQAAISIQDKLETLVADTGFHHIRSAALNKFTLLKGAGFTADRILAFISKSILVEVVRRRIHIMISCLILAGDKVHQLSALCFLCKTGIQGFLCFCRITTFCAGQRIRRFIVQICMIFTQRLFLCIGVKDFLCTVRCNIICGHRNIGL